MDNWIILGVGNPGDKYANTKHNVPWWISTKVRYALYLHIYPQGCLLLKLSNYPLGMIPSPIKDFS